MTRSIGGVTPARQARSRLTADRILDALHLLLRERPLQAITVSEILNEAQVSPSSFYRRFRDREAAFTALIDRVEEAGRDLERRCFSLLLSAPDLRTAVRSILGEYMEFAEEFEDVRANCQAAPFKARQDKIDFGLHGAFAHAADVVLDESDRRRVEQLEFLGRLSGLAIQHSVRPGGLPHIMHIGRDDVLDHLTDLIIGWIDTLPKRALLSA